MDILLSVIIACKNEEKDIEDCIKSLINQTLTRSKYELIFVNGNSEDNTREIIKNYMKNFKNIRLFLENPPISPANARNIGVKKARGKNILFMDADNVATKDYLASVLEGFKKTHAGAIATKTLPLTKNIFGVLMYHERLASDYVALKNVQKFFPNAVKREIFTSLGGFYPQLGYGEDYDFHKKLVKSGYKIVFYPKAKVYHKEPSSFNEIYKECIWWGRTLPFLVKKHPIQLLRLGVIFLRALLPLWIIFMFIPTFSIFGLFLTLVSMLELFRYVIPSIKAGGKLKFALLLPIYKIIKAMCIVVGIFGAIFDSILKK